MDTKKRRDALAGQLTNVQQAIAAAVVQMHQLEGAIAILDEQLKEVPVEPPVKE